MTVTGSLLKKQLVHLDLSTNAREVSLARDDGKYTVQTGDGDLHFCLGTEQLQPHLACELQNAKAWISLFNDSIGATMTVSGFFRCLFEHPGFRQNDDAHVFEVHPVRAISIAGQVQSFDVDVPEQKAIHTWTKPHDLNTQDGRISVEYNQAADTLSFANMDGRDENYVRVSGTISDVQLNENSPEPAGFTFSSDEIGRALRVYCLQGTSAARQLRNLGGTAVSMVVLRNVDLSEALANHYVISLLAIDITEAG